MPLHPATTTDDPHVLGLFDAELLYIAQSLAVLERRLKNYRDQLDADTFGRLSEGLSDVTTGLYEMVCRAPGCSNLGTRVDPDDGEHYCSDPFCWPYEPDPCVICSYLITKGRGIAAADHEGAGEGGLVHPGCYKGDESGQ